LRFVLGLPLPSHCCAAHSATKNLTRKRRALAGYDSTLSRHR
jgi:hypothetical protein